VTIRLLRLLAVVGVLMGVLAFAFSATAQEAIDRTPLGGYDTLGDDALGQHEAERGKFVALAIGLGLGLAAAGGALAQGRATSSAMEGLSRNPGSYDKVFTPFILGMVLIESLVIYSLVISLILLGSLGG
jgi:F0F1-type ATP synthase membrane subunit c/vacuolar-type H+-ATPase subunit K